MTVRVIEATSDKELGEKVAFAINTLSMIPFADWQYNNGLFQVLVMSGTASDVGAFTLLWGSSSLELAAQRDMHTEEGWMPFGSIKYLRGKYVQALARGVPTGGGGPVDIYSDNIVDATAIGKGILTAPLAADVHQLLGAGEAGLDVYGLETKEEIVTYLDIQTGSITADQITDATAIGKSVLRAATTFAAQTAIGGGTSGATCLPRPVPRQHSRPSGAALRGGLCSLLPTRRRYSPHWGWTGTPLPTSNRYASEGSPTATSSARGASIR